MVAGRVSSDGRVYVVVVEGLADLNFRDLPRRSRQAASRALNDTARKYRTISSEKIREQVKFPARYLDSASDGNLRITRLASPLSLEAAITARFRPTSLTRFVQGPVTHGRVGPTLEVRPNKREVATRAFIINLKSGNKGLAVRLSPGERIENKTRMVQMKNGLYLLYGPSVDQVFGQVAEDESDDAADFLETTFTRLMGLEI